LGLLGCLHLSGGLNGRCLTALTFSRGRLNGRSPTGHMLSSGHPHSRGGLKSAAVRLWLRGCAAHRSRQDSGGLNGGALFR
jgi:hypothetical protein